MVRKNYDIEQACLELEAQIFASNQESSTRFVNDVINNDNCSIHCINRTFYNFIVYKMETVRINKKKVNIVI